MLEYEIYTTSDVALLTAFRSKVQSDVGHEKRAISNF